MHHVQQVVLGSFMPRLLINKIINAKIVQIGFISFFFINNSDECLVFWCTGCSQCAHYTHAQAQTEPLPDIIMVATLHAVTAIWPSAHSSLIKYIYVSLRVQPGKECAKHQTRNGAQFRPLCRVERVREKGSVPAAPDFTGKYIVHCTLFMHAGV